MKNINLFSNRMKSIAWILIIVAGYFIMATPFGCKEESFSPDKSTSLASRGGEEGDHLELLGVSCIPDSLLEVCDSFPTIDSMQIMLADYPGCSFWITFELYDCLRDSDQYYHIGNFHIVYHNCSAFTTAFNTAYAAGGATLAAFVENFDHDVFLKIKTNLANTLVPVGTNPCNEGYVTFMSYIRVSCYKWCYIEVGHTASSTKVACGSDCCPERTTACRNDSGVLVFHSEYTSTYPPYCAGPIIFNTGLPRRCTSESSCTYTCPE